MSSMVDDVARVLVPGNWDIVPESKRGHWRREAEAAIAAATPHLRRQFRDELFAEISANSKGVDPDLGEWSDNVVRTWFGPEDGTDDDISHVWQKMDDWAENYARKDQDDAQ